MQRLNQGSKTIEEYYQELLIGLARSNIQEDEMGKCSRFFRGLRRKIHDVLDYKEYTRFSQLYHYALKAEREVQGRQPRHSMTPSTPSRPTEVSKFFDVQTPPAPIKKSSPIAPFSGSATPSSSSSSKVVCHRCKGMGHIAKKIPANAHILLLMIVDMLVLVMKRMNLHLQLIFMQINLRIVLKILTR